MDEITALDIQALKVRLAHRKPKTANNVLAVLSKLLRVAKQLGEIKALPIESVELLKVSQATVVISAKVMRGWMKSAQRLAGLKVTGNFHVLRHTFCSHLAMKGAPAKTIQELAGHAHLSTTLRYMHLAQGHKEQAIRLLDARREPANEPFRGGGVEAETAQ